MSVAFSGFIYTMHGAISQMAVKRKYELKQRARSQAATRRRIVEATAGLHEEVGPAQTTVAEIARRAGVQRLTVYKHFPDEHDLFAACSALFGSQHPPPDPAPWSEISDPVVRMRRALAELHAWYRDQEAMLANVERDMDLLPALRTVVVAGRAPREHAARDVLASGWHVSATAQTRLRGAIGLACSFGAWRRLARGEGLSDGDAIEVLTRLVEASTTA